MILHTDNSKESTRKLLELIKKFSRVAGHKINTQKSVVFQYTSNEQFKKEIKKAIPLVFK